MNGLIKELKRSYDKNKVSQVIRVKLNLSGLVQGVGFRPFVSRLAGKYALSGWVLNDSFGVEIEVEGKRENVEKFVDELKNFPPPRAYITQFSIKFIQPRSESRFVIRSSKKQSRQEVLISPDIAVCDDCVNELFDPENKRYLHPFISCTNCGPRYTIIKDIPYDRHLTTMSVFKMCSSCQKEYENSNDRRFHAQTNACWNCGPILVLKNSKGEKINVSDPIAKVIEVLKEGKIVAIKGVGGFHLACDACSDYAVKELRRRKGREDKPFAIMSSSIEKIKEFCYVTSEEEKLLKMPACPIVLLKKREGKLISQYVAPKNNFLGVMLPYTPIHHIITRSNFTALVMTSGNISDEPIITDNDTAIEKLGNIADFFLLNNRDIHTRCDDSIVRIACNKQMVIRRARGYVPLPISLDRKLPEILAVGAELKNTICLTKGNLAFVSQYIGDLKNYEVYEYFKETIMHLQKLLKIKPKIIAYDLHPAYLSTQFALEQNGLEPIGIQHHEAHIASCMAENQVDDDVIGVAFDGTGYGLDGNIWGSEFFIGSFEQFRRVGHIMSYPLPGGDSAVEEPYRVAISLLYLSFGDSFLEMNIKSIRGIGFKRIGIILQMIKQKVNTPLTTSMGRLFDAVSFILGVCDKATYEAQPAIELESLVSKDVKFEQENRELQYAYEIACDKDVFIISPLPIIRDVVNDLLRGVANHIISVKFHNTLIKIVLDMCQRIEGLSGIRKVVLSGGVFQNVYLLENIVRVLTKSGFEVYYHNLVPTNDGGISLGQVVLAGVRRINGKEYILKPN